MHQINGSITELTTSLIPMLSFLLYILVLVYYHCLPLLRQPIIFHALLIYFKYVLIYLYLYTPSDRNFNYHRNRPPSDPTSTTARGQKLRCNQTISYQYFVSTLWI